MSRETTRLNRERRASGATDRKELAEIEKRIASMIAAIEEGGYVRGMSDRLRELEARQDELNECLAAGPADIPDIHPNIAIVYRRKVERLAEALADPRDRDEAADAIRGLIERIVLTPGDKRGEMHAALHGDLGTILEWAASRRGKGATDTPESGMSVSVVAGGRSGAAGSGPATSVRHNRSPTAMSFPLGNGNPAGGAGNWRARSASRTRPSRHSARWTPLPARSSADTRSTLFAGSRPGSAPIHSSSSSSPGTHPPVHPGRRTLSGTTSCRASAPACIPIAAWSASTSRPLPSCRAPSRAPMPAPRFRIAQPSQFTSLIVPFLPSRAGRSVLENLPNRTMETSSPHARPSIRRCSPYPVGPASRAVRIINIKDGKYPTRSPADNRSLSVAFMRPRGARDGRGWDRARRAAVKRPGGQAPGSFRGDAGRLPGAGPASRRNGREQFGGGVLFRVCLLEKSAR